MATAGRAIAPINPKASPNAHMLRFQRGKRIRNGRVRSEEKAGKRGVIGVPPTVNL